MADVMLFKMLPPVHWARVLPLLRPVIFGAHETVCIQGEVVVESYILIDGLLTVISGEKRHATFFLSLFFYLFFGSLLLSLSGTGLYGSVATPVTCVTSIKLSYPDPPICESPRCQGATNLRDFDDEDSIVPVAAHGGGLGSYSSGGGGRWGQSEIAADFASDRYALGTNQQTHARGPCWLWHYHSPWGHLVTTPPAHCAFLLVRFRAFAFACVCVVGCLCVAQRRRGVV